ncbi:PBP1A family penicillin-binding protein [bacterium]|jgi:penicillin-binding protein 1A|nr:PBP1A family penicillin-binding protein [bacterium]MBT3903575.1 PBP1A family penicillin-binding protein [bacterium]MBT4577917.1 PBP1A family penicillin-binding protein [bacterium]MBT5345718.1 PBP1A family penicillin-binding protein [bacterium]MBT6130800.1 PBP1A family penicillin-binding protein [bacterium]
MKFVRIFFFSCFALALLSSSLLSGFLLYTLNHRCVDLSVLEHDRPSYPSVVLDDQGNEWARFQREKRKPVPFNSMPKHLIDAFIAAEDWAFFSHHGISLKGIARSILVNLYHGRRVQGASTITQQVVRLLFFDARKTIKRKVKEQLFSMLVERQCTKEQILQTYLNHVCFGAGVYGVGAAAKRFWGKSVNQLTIGQAATLAGIVRSPRNYCPLNNPLSAQRRRNIVLNQMRKLELITPKQFIEIKAKPVSTIERDKTQVAPHLLEYIRQFVEQKVGKDALYCDGLIIKTTINNDLQKEATRAFEQQCKKLHKRLKLDVDGALISITPKTGEIKALVGGYNFNESKFNRAFQAKRQLGSTIKPLIYSLAIQQGKTFAHTCIDEPFELNGWEPRNYNKIFEGEMTLARALSMSNNIITIKTLLDVGIKNLIKLAQKAHIQGPFDPYPSLALGCVDCTPQETVGMFNIFANSGVYVQPHSICWIKNRLGKKIYKNSPKKHRVLESFISDQVAQTLTIGVDRYKKRYIPWFKSQAISKTGTTNDSRTCWFCGATPSLTTTIYIGCDDNASMGQHTYPISTAFPIWSTLYKKQAKKIQRFIFSPHLRLKTIHSRTGKPVRRLNSPEHISILVPNDC